MELHESLAQLARDHGESLFAEADAFRGALDDYLDEGSASTGTINLLTDAVRLGALQVDGDDARQRGRRRRRGRDRRPAALARPRQRRRAGSQWACAVLGYALGKVPVSLATRLRPDAYTAEPPKDSPGSSTAARPAGVPRLRPERADEHRRRRATRPPSSGRRPPGRCPAPRRPPPRHPACTRWHPVRSAPVRAAPVRAQPQSVQLSAQYGGPASPYAYTASPGYSSPPPKKSSNGLIIGAIAAIVVLGVVAIILIIALSGGGDDPTADDPTDHDSTTSRTTSSHGRDQQHGHDRSGADPAGRRLHLPVPQQRLEGPDRGHPRHHGDDRLHRRSGQLAQHRARQHPGRDVLLVRQHRRQRPGRRLEGGS